MKKRLIFSFILCVIAILLAGCSTGIKYSEGVDVQYFSPALSSSGTTSQLVPEKFLEKFEYSENRFYHYTNERAFSFGDMDKTLLYLEYDDGIYEKAKEYILTEMDLNFTEKREYNGYVFYLNEDLATRTYFPYQYLMAGYNDDKNRVIFFGMVCVERLYPDVKYGETDLGLYLKIFFGDWYDFDA